MAARRVANSCALCLLLFLTISALAQDNLTSQIALLNQRLTVRPRMNTSQPGSADSDLLTLLQVRQKLVEELMRKEPATVRSVMLPPYVADELRNDSPAYAAAIEVDGEWSGNLEGTIADDFEHGTSTTHWFLHSGASRIELSFASNQNPKSRLHLPVNVSGIGTSRVISAKSIRAMTDVSPAPLPLNCTSNGQENVAVLFMNQPSGPAYPTGFDSSTYWAQRYFGAGAKSANNYWQEASFGVTSATGNFFGPFTLGSGLDCTNTDALASDAITKAKTGGVDFSTYSRISIIYPINSCGFGGLGTIGCRAADSLINHPYSVTWIPVFGFYNNSYDLWGLVAHELGHNLDLAHSSSLDFGNVPLGALDYTETSSGGGSSSKGVKTEYGDPYTVMGGGSNACGGQYTAFSKSQYLTWMNGATDITESTGAGGTFTIAPYENSSGRRALRILRDAQTSSWLWLEYRQPLGSYDPNLTTCQSGTNALSGALTYYESPQSSDGHLFLLDMNPGSSPNDYTNAALTVGQTWTDPNSLLSVTLNSANSSGMSVSATYAQPCATLLISNASYSAPGGTGTITVTAPGTCAWTASTAATWITITSGASGTGNGLVNFSVAGNGTAFQRLGFLTVQRQSVAVTQKGTSTFVSYMSPALQQGASATPTFTFTDPSGFADISNLVIQFQGDQCYIYADQVGSGPTSWFFFLLDPTTNAFSNSVSPGQNLTVSNSNCSLNGSTSSVNTTGNTATISLSLSFNNVFSGSHRVTASYCDAGGSNCSPDITLGTWRVSAASGQAQLSGSSLSFGHQNTSTTSSTQQVTLTNNGQAVLNISSIVATAEFAVTHNCGSSVAINGNCTLNVSFQPISPGPKSGAVTITDDAINSPQTISLSGFGDYVAPISRPERPGRPGVITHAALRSMVVKFSDLELTAHARYISCTAPRGVSCSVQPAATGALNHTRVVKVRANASKVHAGNFRLRLTLRTSGKVRTLFIPLHISERGELSHLTQ